MEPTRISGAQAVVKTLVEQKVKTIFGYPGGAIMPIYDALYDYQNSLEHILVRHEQGAIHAAQGYARTSRKPGVVFATSGPGATNLITGLADAFIDSTPLVCITGQVSSALLGTDAFQETDIIGISLPVTKWNYQITKASEIPFVLAKAFYIASSGRPGPVLIDITKDAQFEKVDYLTGKCDFIRSYKPIPQINMESIALASDLLNNAKKPFIIIGQGVILSKAEDQLKNFIEKTGIPVASTLLGLGALASTHPQYVGLLGMHGHYAPNIKTNQCDVLLAIGMRFDDRVTGNLQTYAKQAKVIHIDIDKAEIDKNVKTHLGIHADAQQALTALLPLVKPNSHLDWLQEFKNEKQYEVACLNQNYQGYDPQQIKMNQVVKYLSDKTSGQAVIVTDVGQHQMITARYYGFNTSNNNITSGGLGTMGFALPACIGAKYGAPKKQVIAIIGDGGFQMTLQELGTIMQNDVDVKIVILNNKFLGMVRQWQQLFFDKRYSHTNISSPDFVALAKSYNIQGQRIDNLDQINQGIDLMLQSKGPYLLEVMVTKEENVFPMIPAGACVSQVRLSE
ncbi:biosynthetic-type acetolactate synthase large subunit [Myroides sp. LJL119]